jgi:PAS domain S-box-containing protein
MGYPVERLLGIRFTELVRPDRRDEVLAFYIRQLEEGVLNTYLEFPAVSADGREVWIGQNVRLLHRDGVVSGVQAVARDITARHEVERMKDEFVGMVSHELRTPLTGRPGARHPRRQGAHPLRPLPAGGPLRLAPEGGHRARAGHLQGDRGGARRPHRRGERRRRRQHLLVHAAGFGARFLSAVRPDRNRWNLTRRRGESRRKGGGRINRRERSPQSQDTSRNILVGEIAGGLSIRHQLPARLRWSLARTLQGLVIPSPVIDCALCAIPLNVILKEPQRLKDLRTGHERQPNNAHVQSAEFRSPGLPSE